MKKLVVFLCLAVAIAGCTTTQKGAATGAAVGAGVGAIIGHQSGKKNNLTLVTTLAGFIIKGLN